MYLVIIEKPNRTKFGTTLIRDFKSLMQYLANYKKELIADGIYFIKNKIFRKVALGLSNDSDTGYPYEFNDPATITILNIETNNKEINKILSHHKQVSLPFYDFVQVVRSSDYLSNFFYSKFGMYTHYPKEGNLESFKINLMKYYIDNYIWRLK